MLRSLALAVLLTASGVTSCYGCDISREHAGPSESAKIRFKILVLSEDGGHHLAFTKAAKVWLNQLALDSSLSIDYIKNTDRIDEEFLEQYSLFIQLDFPPYRWSTKAMSAFQGYIRNGNGGWIGFHHATLLGEFDGYPMWSWFSDFMGGIRFANYIPKFATAQVNVEEATHPCMKGVPHSFSFKDEWYTYDKSPRPNVHVIASVDESSYSPASDIKMGDHPVIWTNEHFASRNIYIFMGHSPELLADNIYRTIFRNAIFWAAAPTNNKLK